MGGRRAAGRGLYRGEALREAVEWAATGRRHLTLNGGEQAFLDAGLALGRRRSRTRWRAAAALVAAALALAFWQYGSARGSVDEAMARVAAARAGEVRIADPVTARKLSLTAWRLAPVPEARRALAASGADPVTFAFRDPGATERSEHVLSPDGRRLAALTDGVLTVYDTADGRRVTGAPGPPEKVRAMAWSPDGRTLAVIGLERSYLWDTAGVAAWKGFGRGLAAPGVHTAWFSPGGRYLLASAREFGERWAWDLRDGRAVFGDDPVVVGPGDRRALVFDGRRSRIVELGDGRVTAAAWLARMPPEYAGFAPDGERVAIAEEAGLQVYDLAGVPVLGQPLGPSGRPVFSPDGTFVAGTGSDRVRVWRVADGRLSADRALPASVDRAAQAAFSQDGARLVVLAGRGTVLSIPPAPVPRASAAGQDAAAQAEGICAGPGGLTPAEWARHLPGLAYREVC
ncbi:hypothetical protein OIE66_05135 [Nonomuraea sp. NBC_01738]|uniref:WD40 repeat domain-containing protein n=1 Tax=Nonomuraea sp. NBC_01738 TaxID=2976003 RepID=UPI002E0FB13C|nr:hypothetical protein OIE66_05135 [Nonomuraea sp. NBC_01738]